MMGESWRGEAAKACYGEEHLLLFYLSLRSRGWNHIHGFYNNSICIAPVPSTTPFYCHFIWYLDIPSVLAVPLLETHSLYTCSIFVFGQFQNHKDFVHLQKCVLFVMTTICWWFLVMVIYSSFSKRPDQIRNFDLNQNTIIAFSPTQIMQKCMVVIIKNISNSLLQ